MSDKIRKCEGNVVRGGVPQTLYLFFCPGCKYGHAFDVPHWYWNGSMTAPTFSPSLMVNQGRANQCHSIVTDGKIAFCSDSHHELAGKTVDLPDIDTAYEEARDE